MFIRATYLNLEERKKQVHINKIGDSSIKGGSGIKFNNGKAIVSLRIMALTILSN